VIGQESSDLAPGQALDDLACVLAELPLKDPAHSPHELLLILLGKSLLGSRHRVLEDDRDDAVVDVRSSAGRPPPDVLLVEGNHGLREVPREVAGGLDILRLILFERGHTFNCYSSGPEKGEDGPKGPPSRLSARHTLRR
jgi:hypothetical protein